MEHLTTVSSLELLYAYAYDGNNDDFSMLQN